ncbi:MAG: response regulator [Myxococcota bacterium]|nr:response regulator [Myxococcota bacterium]
MKPTPDIADRPARVLIVDDERHNRQLLEVMLASEGFVFETATSGAEALAIVAQHPPDLILLDVMMPGMDGYEVAAQIKADFATKNIPVIMVTALDDRNAKMLGLNAGVEDFLSKPVDRSELRVRIRNLLRLKAYGDYHDRYGQILEGVVDSREADLVESERLYRSTFEAAPVGIAHVALDGRWLRVNQRLCDQLGYAHEDLEIIAIQELLQSEDADEAELFRRMVADTLDRHVIDEKRYRRRNGTFMWARVNMSIHRNAAGQAQQFILVIEDITERRILEAHIQQANKLDAIGGLAAGIAHDFNNLMSVVLSYSELLAGDLKQGDPMRDDLDQIGIAGRRAVDLTRQLLAFSRQQALQPKIIDLREIVGGMEKMLGRLIGEDVELIATVTPALGRIMVDPGQMEQVVMNLAVNARDAMPAGGKLTIETADVVLNETYASKHVGVKPGPHVLLTVSDTGTGMDEVTQARMFEPFFTTKEAAKGTGLGLATVFGIVRQSGGTIAVDSELGKGTTFRVYFPTIDRAVIVRGSMPPQDRRTLRGSETILLVEDDEHVRILARTILRKYGYNVLDAHSGGDALLLCEQHDSVIHLLVTDVVMPRMSGPQLAARLLSLRPEMKVLYISGYEGDGVMRHGIVDPAVQLLEKPFTPEMLARKVREVLGAPRMSLAPGM